MNRGCRSISSSKKVQKVNSSNFKPNITAYIGAHDMYLSETVAPLWYFKFIKRVTDGG